MTVNALIGRCHLLWTCFRERGIVHRDATSPKTLETNSSPVHDHPPSPVLTNRSSSTPTRKREMSLPTPAYPHPPIPCPWAFFSLCSIQTLDRMLQNYFRTLYTLTPIIDQTSLQSYFSNPQTSSATKQEKHTFCLVLSVCAYYTTAFPRRFDEYRAHDPTFEARSCREFLHRCETFILSQRPVEYFEVSMHEKCVIAYFLALSFGLIGLPGRAFWYIAEAKYHIRRLGYDSQSRYAELDDIQSELAKRMYWLYVVTEIHEHLGLEEQNTEWEPLPSDRLFRRRDFAFLYSMQTKTKTSSTTNPPTDASDLVSTGLSYLVKIYLTFVSPHPFQAQSIHSITDATDTDRLHTHDAGTSPSTIYDIMQRHLEHALDGAPQDLQWAWNSTIPSERHNAPAAVSASFNHAGAVRANLHVSRIWAKSAIFERSVIAQTESHSSAEYDPETWETRIRIGEELLAFIESADTSSFEVNAPSITSKIRRIAASLLLSEPTIEIPAELGRRVRDLLHRILVFLADLNRFSLQDTQFSEGIEKLARHP
ncbi:hypothetical protein BJX62DRAFT_79304 [Aspergillus germanicus]